MKRDTKKLMCEIHPVGALGAYKFAVILSYEGGRILLSRRNDRETWEHQGGHIEPGETPVEAAKRELWEESGALDYNIKPLCDYRGYDDQSSSNGMVFLAEIRTRGPLPKSEMAEARAFPRLPESLTYPNVTSALCTYAEANFAQIIHPSSSTA